MEAMRQSWTDERLDDFRAETACRFGVLERRMDEGFGRVDAKFDRFDERSTPSIRPFCSSATGCYSSASARSSLS
jgi:hypothetical protein